LKWVQRFNILLDTDNLPNLPSHLLTGAEHPAFSINHLTDIDKTKQNNNQQQQQKPKQYKTRSQAVARIPTVLPKIVGVT